MFDHSSLVAELRRFNRFYTRTIGLLEETLTHSRYTLAEARVLFELGHRAAAATASVGGEREFLAGMFNLNAGPAASEIAEMLRLDAAYLARILRKFSGDGLIVVRPDPSDGRRRILTLTKHGQAELASLQQAADLEIGQLVENLSDAGRDELGRALRRTRDLLGGKADEPGGVALRPHEIGDVGWVIERQSKMYAEEYGWNHEYEALVCEIGAKFLREFKPGKEFCWIAERDGVRLGAVFLVRRSDEEAQLRMLHVERAARGQGIGRLLVETCVRTARDVGYRRMMLWTNDVLTDARKIYERVGFRLVSQDSHHSFGHDLHGQNWELDL